MIVSFAFGLLLVLIFYYVFRESYNETSKTDTRPIYNSSSTQQRKYFPQYWTVPPVGLVSLKNRPILNPYGQPGTIRRAGIQTEYPRNTLFINT
jgi:hypothetical protein